MRVETLGLNCVYTPTFPADAVSDIRNYYDNTTAYTTAPTVGNVRRVDAVTKYTGSTPTVVKQKTATYDQWGRTTSVMDALDHGVSTVYTQAAGLQTSRVDTNALGHTTTTSYSSARGLPLTITDANSKVTNVSYDALGRLLKVWKPGHATSGTPDIEYQYGLQQGAPSFTRSRLLGPNGNQIDSYEIYDGLLRSRQIQATAPGTGKRTITDTQYDSQGRSIKKSIFYDGNAVPGSTLVSAADTAIDQQSRYTYDNAGRQLTDELWSMNVFKWKSTTVHGGDRQGTIPPTGGTVSQDITDPRGRVIEHQQYTGSTLTGTPDSTKYTYDHAGRLVKLVDTLGNETTFSYNLMGSKTQTVDPDAGCCATSVVTMAAS